MIFSRRYRTLSMPLDRRGAVQLGLLILILPTQLLLTTYFGATSSQKDQNLKRLYESISNFKAQFLSWDLWEAWCVDLYSKAKSVLITSKTPAGENQESLAVEVINYRSSKGYFASSAEPRSPRPQNVKYRIGQVVRHKQKKYRGVIIGWDAVVKAPDSWLQNSIPADKSHWKKLPAYLLLIDTRDGGQLESVYVVEENLELLQRTMVIHPKLENYFDGFDGFRYLPRQRLRVIYPHD